MSAAHIPGCNDVEANLCSNELEDATEWQPSATVFKIS